MVSLLASAANAWAPFETSIPASEKGSASNFEDPKTGNHKNGSQSCPTNWGPMEGKVKGLLGCWGKHTSLPILCVQDRKKVGFPTLTSLGPKGSFHPKWVPLKHAHTHTVGAVRGHEKQRRKACLVRVPVRSTRRHHGAEANLRGEFFRESVLPKGPRPFSFPVFFSGSFCYQGKANILRLVSSEVRAGRIPGLMGEVIPRQL